MRNNVFYRSIVIVRNFVTMDAMKVSDESKPNVDLEKLANTLSELDPETYPDYIADWPLEELREKIAKSEASGDSGITSAEEHLAYFAKNPL